MQHAACSVQQTVQVATTFRFATVVFVLGLFKLTNNAAGSGSQRAIHNNDGAAAAAAATACGMWHVALAALARSSVAEQAWQSIWQTWHNNLLKPRTKLLTKKTREGESRGRRGRERERRQGGRQWQQQDSWHRNINNINKSRLDICL